MVFSRTNLRLLSACMLLAATCVFLTNNARGSIIVPDDDVALGDFDKFLADLDKPESSSGASTGATPSEQPIERPSEREPSRRLAAALSPTGSSPSNTSTSSTSGSSGTGSTPIYSAAATTSLDLDWIGWCNGEARYALPMPPGNDLLRPPQQC